MFIALEFRCIVYERIMLVPVNSIDRAESRSECAERENEYDDGEMERYSMERKRERKQKEIKKKNVVDSAQYLLIGIKSGKS